MKASAAERIASAFIIKGGSFNWKILQLIQKDGTCLIVYNIERIA